MNVHKILGSLIFIFIIFSCSEELTSPTGDYEVSGRVLSKGIPVENAIVKLNDSETLKTATDNDGYFKLLNVPKGNYDLTISKNINNGSFSERTSSITVDSDLNLNSLILPKGITVYEPEGITDKSLKLFWSAMDALDFREYKVYQHSTSGLDETTGTLIHVSTSVDDTSFTVKDLNPLTDYYFRIYVMNDFGRLGGSNIVSVKTKNLEILKNRSFELLNLNTGYPANWNFHISGGLWLVDSTVVKDGKYSLSVHGQSGIGEQMPWQSINPSGLVGGSRYKLTYWIKNDELQSGNYSQDFAIYMHDEEFTWHIEINQVYGPAPASDWKEYTYEFTMPSVETSNFNIRLYFLLAPDTYAWIDNMSLTKVE